MKRPISLLIDQLHLMSNIHLFPPRSADGSLVGKSGEWYEPYCKNWLFEDVHPCGRLRKRTVLLYMLSGTKRSFLETIELVVEAEAHHPAQSPKGVMCQDAPLDTCSYDRLLMLKGSIAIKPANFIATCGFSSSENAEEDLILSQ